MIVNPFRPRTTVSIGVFSGRVVGVLPNGDGEVIGHAGPHRVLVPASLMNGSRPGGDITYYATVMPSGKAVAARLIHMASDRANGRVEAGGPFPVGKPPGQP